VNSAAFLERVANSISRSSFWCLPPFLVLLLSACPAGEATAGQSEFRHWRLESLAEHTLRREGKQVSSRTSTAARVESRSEVLSNGNTRHSLRLWEIRTASGNEAIRSVRPLPGEYSFSIEVTPGGQIVSYPSGVPADLIPPGFVTHLDRPPPEVGSAWKKYKSVALPGGLRPISVSTEYRATREVREAGKDCVEVRFRVGNSKDIYRRSFLDTTFEIRIWGEGVLVWAKDSGTIVRAELLQEIDVEYGNSKKISRKTTSRIVALGEGSRGEADP